MSYNSLVKDYLYTYFGVINNSQVVLLNEENSFPVKRENNENAIVEVFVGHVLNKLHSKIPNFCKVQKLDIKNSTIYYLQYADNSLKNFFKTCTTLEFYNCILQIILALGKAQEKYKFNHNNLTIDNIFIDVNNPVINSYKFGSIMYDIKTNVTPVITNYKHSRISYDGFVACYTNSTDKDPTDYDKSVDIVTFLKSCETYMKKYSPIYNEINWIFKFTDTPKEQINTLTFLNFFSYNKNEIFYSLIKVQQRKLNPFLPYKLSRKYISKSKLINTYMETVKNDTDDYDLFLLTNYKNILKDIEISPKYSDVELVELYKTKLFVVKSFIIFLRLKNEHEYLPGLFSMKESLIDKIDNIKVKYLSYLYHNITKCLNAYSIYALKIFYPLMNDTLNNISLASGGINDKICKK